MTEPYSDTLLKILEKRRSIRKYTDKPLTQQQVVELMKAALYAPSSRNRQPLQYILVDNKDDLSRLSECKASGAQPIAGAAIAIVVAADPERSDVWIEDASIASTFLLLQAEALELGACWIQVRNRFFEDDTSAAEIVRSILGIPPNLEILSIVAVGNKDSVKPAHDESELKWEKVHIDKY